MGIQHPYFASPLEGEEDAARFLDYRTRRVRWVEGIIFSLSPRRFGGEGRGAPLGGPRVRGSRLHLTYHGHPAQPGVDAFPMLLPLTLTLTP